MHKHGFFHRDLKPENLLINDGLREVEEHQRWNRLVYDKTVSLLPIPSLDLGHGEPVDVPTTARGLGAMG